MMQPILFADYVSGVLWYHMLMVLQWVLLNSFFFSRMRRKKGYEHLFRYPSWESGVRPVEGEEGGNQRRLRVRKTGRLRTYLGIFTLVFFTAKSWFIWFWFPKEKPFIELVDRIKRRLMTSHEKRYRFWKIVYTIFLVLIGLYFVGQYTSQQIDTFRYVTPETVHEQTGTSITNIVSMNRFTLSPTYGSDQEWLLYGCKQRPKMTPERMMFGYVEVDTYSFGSVNISIDDVVDRMKRDSREMGVSLPQPCICAAHYGIPLNVVLLRDFASKTKSPEAPGLNDKVLYEPMIAQTTSDAIKGTVSSDSLVVPNKDARRIPKFPIKGVPISPMDNLRILSMQKEFTAEVNEAVSTYTYPREIFTNIVDLTDKPLSSSVSKWIFGRLSVPIKAVRDAPTREVTVGYDNMVVRALNKDGSKATATYLYSPYSICLQRCIASISYMKTQ